MTLQSSLRTQIVKVRNKPLERVERSQQNWRLAESLRRYMPFAAADMAAMEAMALHARPAAFADHLNCVLAGSGVKVRVRGALDGRLIIFSEAADRHWFCTLTGTLSTLPIPGLGASADLLNGNDVWGRLVETKAGWTDWMDSPRVFLVALYHPEFFPLPRFALGISDIARALRQQLIGTVDLLDMQLGIGLDEVVDTILRHKPDILGISATFGQHDILQQVLEKTLKHAGAQTLTIVGGSLASLNAELLIKQFPSLLVAKGAGEATMREVVRYWRGLCPMDAIPDVAYLTPQGSVERTSKSSNRGYGDIIPELDLLGATLDANGAMQLESSRGCSYACSFCPREHKGIWAGDAPDSLHQIMTDVSEAFDQHPGTARRIFLVDEEMVGYERDSLSLGRVEQVASILRSYNFTFETSSRVDQVVRNNRDKSWHVDRADFWRSLRKGGLARCLFGVESGVDSILKRFNKKTTGHQNALAIRTLTACGIPIRCTYITFDHLMTFNELFQTYQFQGRRDLLLRPCPELNAEEIVDLVNSEECVNKLSSNRPFYEEISYMLVSMECLIGSKYLEAVEAEGLAGEFQLSMGRREASFRDPRIGLMSYYSQCWIDRNFSMDYTLKSIEKVAGVEVREEVHRMRRLIKEAAYGLLGDFLDEFSSTEWSGLITGGDIRQAGRERTPKILDIMDGKFRSLTTVMGSMLADIKPGLSANHLEVIERENATWKTRTEWGHINA